MDDTEVLSALIGDIYDAALDQTLWHDIVAKSSQFVGGVGASLFTKDAVSRQGDIYQVTGISKEFEKLYFDKYAKLDPTTTGQFFAAPEEPISVADLMPYREFLDTAFYKEWVKPQGLADFICAVLDKSISNAAMFGVFLRSPANEDMRHRMNLIVPHIRRAVLIGRLIDLKTAEHAKFSDTIDGMNAAICLVNADGRIVHANAAFHTLAAAGDAVSSTNGRLATHDNAINRSLRDIFTGASGGDKGVGVQGIAMPLISGDGTRYLLHVLPLTSGVRRLAGKSSAAVAALFIRKAELEPLPPPEVIAGTFKLTPTELRVLLAMVETSGVAGAAASLGITENTVKTHVSRLFEKMRVNRQADLVKIVAGFSTPLIQ
jgi:DNA-binding CsgD family transcriptional regulator/PAS domain-containing protein